MNVPFVDLKAQYSSLKSEIDSAIANVISETAFIGGSSNKFVSCFEKEFGQFLNMNHVISCANGTDSIEILLEAYNISSGDEVIVPAISWIATSEAVGRAGATPIFIDVCEDTLLMNLDKLEEKITPKTKAIIPVHLYGNPIDMEKLMSIANKHNLIVIEDCAQAHGAEFNGKKVGTFGHASSFSFYPGKNLGAYGDAGCMVTNDSIIASKCRMISNHGQLEKHNHLIEGRNSRMDGIHAAVLSVKLKYIELWNNKRIEHSRELSKKINQSNLSVINKHQNSKHVYHLFVVKHRLRDELKKFLSDKGIETAIHYPHALPFLKAYENFNYLEKDFPVAFNETKRILSLPMFPELTTKQIDYLVSALNEFCNQND